jgi:hypothetical protein
MVAGEVVCNVVVRLPDGSRLNRRFRMSDTIRVRFALGRAPPPSFDPSSSTPLTCVCRVALCVRLQSIYDFVDVNEPAGLDLGSYDLVRASSYLARTLLSLAQLGRSVLTARVVGTGTVQVTNYPRQAHPENDVTIQEARLDSQALLFVQLK